MEKRKDDIALIRRIKKYSCENSLKELIQRHSPICFDVYRKYSTPLVNSGVCVDFSFMEKDIIIYKSALSFKTNKKSKFSTWVANQVRYYCLNSMNRNDLIPTDDKTIHYYIDKQGAVTSETNNNLRENLEYIYNILDQVKDKRIKNIFSQRYFLNADKKSPWALIAKNIGISTQTAINLHDKGISILRKKIHSNSEFTIDII